MDHKRIAMSRTDFDPPHLRGTGIWLATLAAMTL